MSEDGISTMDHLDTQQAQKRKAGQAGLDGAQPRAVKRRASKACQCCRARKVRCNVTEHGAPCTNCRLDEVECIVSESRRKKKFNKEGESQPEQDASLKANNRKLASRGSIEGFTTQNENVRRSHDFSALGDHVPHSIYRTQGQKINVQNVNRRQSFGSMSVGSPYPIMHHSPMSVDSMHGIFSTRTNAADNLPYYIKPLPPRIGSDEIEYLEKKGVLSVPQPALRNELLKAYIEFVHPYMPLIDLYDFVMVIESGNGNLGRISLILYQAVMFAGSAFVDMSHLQNAGYVSRKEARKDFFQKTRLLYEFDYESDRVSLVQALLLLTYYYETPDDQKDTWHWMGVATSVAHTIGLHRNPDRSTMSLKKTKLWKRIWWSTYMRDRLIALGMRRPTRIKTEDYDVPMLTLDDFDLRAIPDSVSCVPADCTVARDVEKQRQLAMMCIEKAKLCLCISHVLTKQYCVLNNNQGMVNDRTTMMLLPKKLDPETCEVQDCDSELEEWLQNLPEEAKHRETLTGCPSLDLNRSLLHMVFFTTLSALHRPQVLPSAPTAAPTTEAALELLECSRRNVRRAAMEITSLAQILDQADLVKYLPTTGVTVLLPAIIIHLLDIKAPDEATRRASLRGFCQCMQVMGKLRDLYAAADYSTAFLEAAIRKAGIHIAPFPTGTVSGSQVQNRGMHNKGSPASSIEDLVDAGRRMEAATMPPPARTLTPPPDNGHDKANLSKNNSAVTDEEVARRLETFLASTPPESDHASSHSHHDNLSIADTTTSLLDTHSHAESSSDNNNNPTSLGTTTAALMNNTSMLPDAFSFSSTAMIPDFDQDDFDTLLNFDAMAAGEDSSWNFEDGFKIGGMDIGWLGGNSGNASGEKMGEDERHDEAEIPAIALTV